METKEIVSAAYRELELKVKELQDAVDKFGEVYDTHFVGLNEFNESLDEFMFELDSDIQQSLDDEEDE